MYSIDVMVEEHNNILRFNQMMRRACAGILEGKEVCVSDFEQMIAFARNYADKHHHGKEELLLFKEMQTHLGELGTNLITHGMLVEHDLGRLFISELEAAVQKYEKDPSTENRLDIIANAIGYTGLLQRHIDKENDVIYVYAQKNLPEKILNEVDEKTADFERQAQEANIQDTCLGTLKTLVAKYR